MALKANLIPRVIIINQFDRDIGSSEIVSEFCILYSSPQLLIGQTLIKYGLFGSPNSQILIKSQRRIGRYLGFLSNFTLSAKLLCDSCTYSTFITMERVLQWGNALDS